MSRPAAGALRTLLLCQGVLVAGLTLSFPFMTLYLHERRGLPMGAVGLAIGLTTLATAAGQGLGGEAADLWGCKRVMAASLALRAGATALMAWAILASRPVACVIAAAVAAGFFGNFYDPAVRAWLAHEHPAGGRVRAFGLLRVVSNAAWALGPAVGGLLAGRSYALLFAVTAAACLLCLVLLLAVVPEAPAARVGEPFSWSAFSSAAADARFLRFAALTVLVATVMGQLVTPLSAHAAARGLGEEQVGLLFAVNGALVVLFQHAMTGVLVGRSLALATAGGCLFYAAGWSLVGFSGRWPALALGVAIATAGEIIVSPSLQTLAANMAPERLRGRYLGVQGLAYQVGQSLGPALGGLGQERLAWTPAPWLAAAALAGAAGAGFARFSRALSPQEQGLDASEVS